jgi:uncharacterized RDD family membrane protein YckC
MESALPYTRSLVRRFFAYAVDSILAGIAVTLIILPLEPMAGNSFRLSSGLVDFTYCEDGQDIFGPNGEPVSTKGFSKTEVCTTIVNFVFKNREARFTQSETETTVTPNWTTSYESSQSVSIPIDDQNRVVQPIYLDVVFWLVLILAAAAFETSGFQATPGKLLLGLRVNSAVSDKVSPKAALIRNVLKNSWFVFSLMEFFASLSFRSQSPYIQDGKVIIPPDLWEQLQFSTILVLAIVLFMIVIVIGLFLPWRKAGRALYDKLAGTYVIRTGAS